MASPNQLTLILRLIDRVSPSTNQIARNMKDATDAAEELGKVTKAAAATMALMASSKILDFVIDSTKEFASAESAMRRLETVAKATAATFETELGGAFKSAQKFAQDHRFTVEEVLDTYFQFGTAGFALAESVKLGHEALFLANAVMLDVTTSAQLLATVMNSLGQTTSLAFEDIGSAGKRASSALATSIQLFAVTGQQLSAGMKFAIGSASLLGIEIEDLVTAMGQLNTAGLKGSIAGTALNQAFVQLDKAVVKLGLDIGEFTDEAGKFTNIADLVQEVKRVIGDLGPFERFNAVIDGFGIRGARAISALLPFADEMRNISSGMRENGNQAQRLSDIFENSLETRLKRVNNELKVAQQELGKNFQHAAIAATKAATIWAKGIGRVTNALGPVGTIVAVVVVAIGGMVVGLYALVTALGIATGKTIAFAAAMKLILVSPIGVFLAIAAGVATLIVALGAGNSELDKTRQKIAELDQVSLKRITEQFKRLQAAIKLKDDPKAKPDAVGRAERDIADIEKTAAGPGLKRAATLANEYGIAIDDAAKITQQAIKAMLDAGALSDVNIVDITPAELDALAKIVELTRDLSDIQPGMKSGVTHGIKQSISGGKLLQKHLGDQGAAVDELKAKVVSLYEDFAQDALSSTKSAQNWARMLGKSFNETIELAESVKQSFHDLGFDTARWYTLGISDYTDVGDMTRSLKTFLDTIAPVGAALEAAFGDAFIDIIAFGVALQRTIDLQKQGNTLAGQRAQIESRLTEKGVGVASAGADALVIDKKRLEIIKQEITNLEKTLSLQAKTIALAKDSKLEDKTGFSLEQVTNKFFQAAELLIKKRAELSDLIQDVGLQEIAIGAGLIRFAEKGQITDTFKEAISVGLEKGLEEGRHAFAVKLFEEVRASIVKGSVAGFGATAGMKGFFESIEQQAKNLFTAAQASSSAQIPALISNALKNIQLTFDLTKADQGLQALISFSDQLIQMLGPNLGDAITGAFNRGKTALDEITSAIGQLRAQLLAARSGADKGVFQQLINLQRGIGKVGGFDIAGAGLDVQVQALETLLKSVTTAGGDLAASSTAVQAILTAYESIATKQEEAKKASVAMNSPMNATAAAASSTASSAAAVSTSLSGANTAAQNLAAAFREGGVELDAMLNRLQGLAAGSTTLSNVRARPGGDPGEIMLSIGDFNIAVDVGGGGVDWEEQRAGLESGLRRSMQTIEQQILDKVLEVISNMDK